MKDIIEGVLGRYEFQYAPDGSLITGFAGLDYEWLIGAACFVVCLCGVFSLFRVFLKGVR